VQIPLPNGLAVLGLAALALQMELPGGQAQVLVETQRFGQPLGQHRQVNIDGEIEVVGQLATAARLMEEVERVHPDVVLLDIEMPGPDAFEMTDRMKRKYPDVRVIVLSAHIRDAFITASFRAGVCAYFAKSDDLNDIVRGIHEVTRGQSGTFLLGPKVSERCRPTSVGNSAEDVGDRDDSSVMHAGSPKTLLDSLTDREGEILRLIGKGLSRNQIAAQLSRSAKTVDAHQSRMMKKLGIAARADLMRFAIREGLAQA
jgi:DNA-binding NarL/FixJ family response regulator